MTHLRKTLLPSLAFAALGLSGCMTTEQLVDLHAQECRTIGYEPGTLRYTECIEEGYRGSVAAQQEAVDSAVDAALTYAILDAIW